MSPCYPGPLLTSKDAIRKSKSVCAFCRFSPAVPEVPEIISTSCLTPDNFASAGTRQASTT